MGRFRAALFAFRVDLGYTERVFNGVKVSVLFLYLALVDIVAGLPLWPTSGVLQLFLIYFFSSIVCIGIPMYGSVVMRCGGLREAKFDILEGLLEVSDSMKFEVFVRTGGLSGARIPLYRVWATRKRLKNRCLSFISAW